MSWKAFRIGVLPLAIAAWPLATSAAAQDKTIFMPLLVYRTGPYAPNGIPIANAASDYFNLAERARRRDQRRQGRDRGVRDAVRHQAGRRVLRAPEGEGPADHQPVQHGHRVPAHPQGRRRQGRRPLDGLRHDGVRRRALVPLGVQLPDDLLEPGVRLREVRGPAGRRDGQAEGQEDRPHLPQQPVRQGGEPDARDAVEAVRVRPDAAPRSTTPGRSRRRPGSRSAG